MQWRIEKWILIRVVCITKCQNSLLSRILQVLSPVRIWFNQPRCFSRIALQPNTVLPETYNRSVFRFQLNLSIILIRVPTKNIWKTLLEGTNPPGSSSCLICGCHISTTSRFYLVFDLWILINRTISEIVSSKLDNVRNSTIPRISSWLINCRIEIKRVW